jgi:protein-disulfide isomerase
VSLTGGHIVIGARYSLDEDPVETRRKAFAGADEVIWDHAAAGAKVQIVEFSDLECPACRVKWPLIKGAVQKHGDAVVHGMVHFPLPAIHPWAFRAASAAWCVADQDASQQSAFKETFYSMQGIMEVDLVTSTAKDTVVGSGLDEAAFDACYLRPVSIDAIHAQMNLGNRLGINSTPTYFVNGWLVQGARRIVVRRHGRQYRGDWRSQQPLKTRGSTPSRVDGSAGPLEPRRFPLLRGDAGRGSARARDGSVQPVFPVSVTRG